MPIDWRERFRALQKEWSGKLALKRRGGERTAGAAADVSVRPYALGGGASDAAQLLEQLKVAHTDWICAQQRLDYVVSEDEIDYAIFALETAEKRYGILLKQAKAMNVSAYGASASATASVGMPAQQKRTLGG
ncbi:YaaL family protein [Paenibacillus sp. TRM 82003]|nr:YaaL family protein [Paenibacillus sp. TRM 82003]